MKIIQRAIRYIQLSKEEKIFFLEALILLISWKFKIVFLRMPSYVRFFGEKGKEIEHADASKAELITLVQKSVRRADSVLPWNSKCLALAVVTKRLLVRNAVKSTLYLGVAKDERQKLIAHAWLSWGGRIISGERGHEKFTIVQKFT